MNRLLTMPLIFIYAYTVVLVMGYYMMSGRPQTEGSPSWKAARDLAMNHQLREGDLKESESWSERSGLPALESQLGKHLLAAKKKGESVQPKDLGVQPSISSGDFQHDVFLFSLKEELMLAEVLDANSWVKPCFIVEEERSGGPAFTKCLDPPLAVSAVHRAISDKDPPWVALRVPLARTAELGGFVTAAKRFLLVVAAPRSETPIQPTAAHSRGVIHSCWW